MAEEALKQILIEEKKVLKKPSGKKTKSRPKRFIINTTNCRGHLPLLEAIAQSDTEIGISNHKGKLRWHAIQPDDDDWPRHKNKIFNKIYGIESIVTKKGLG